MIQIGTIAELWRYPVKGMRGECLTEAVLEPAGVVGDRRFAFESTAAPRGKPMLASRERTAMLLYTPHLKPAAQVITPAGQTLPLASPELLAELHARLAAPEAQLTLRASPGLPLTDVRPVSLVSMATLRGISAELGRSIDPQRFRSNVVLVLDDEQPFAEDAFAGATLRFGNEDGPQLRVLERIPRCRIVSLDPKTTEPDPELLRHLARYHHGRLGIYANVRKPGMLREGDPVFHVQSQDFRAAS